MNKGIKNHAFILLKNVFVNATWLAILEQISTLTMESKIRLGIMGHGLLLIHKWPYMCVCLMVVALPIPKLVYRLSASLTESAVGTAI